VGEIEVAHLPMEDSPNAGHITVMHHQKGFSIWFELLYNAQRITEHLFAAREFLAEVHGDLRPGSSLPVAPGTADAPAAA
jgi:hypothetical protein